MQTCLFVSDLHGREERYRKLWRAVEEERPKAVFLGGDLVGLRGGANGPDLMAAGLSGLKNRLNADYPHVFLILGNDDPRSDEGRYLDLEAEGLLTYANQRRTPFGSYTVYGYSFVPPTPFHLKDWERYDVSRFIDPGCVSPEEGLRTVEVGPRETRNRTIREDLEELAGGEELEDAIFLFHTPPYRTKLDRAALDGRMVDHAPVDVHVGSIAVERFIRSRRPWITLHGHVHESARITGSWKDRIGRTHLFSAAHDGPELSLVRFDPADPDTATRELL
ncbi:MAG: metallophosphoesterase [Acidobacteria bacterium]|uniref:Metallophosphoesterase n=1 Tax=Candidatus Polarisedimenticola svalbardensis TaxID=2886004 RepID=A0A8J7CDT3_9BACT|nr:metallophosphoesterase [Candidatus Polarisedimenticola svalbardensis]